MTEADQPGLEQSLAARFPDIQTIVRHGLCAGCGLCESLAGRERVEMSITSASQMRPRVRRPIDDATMAKVRAVCPGIRLNGPGVEEVADKGVMHDIFGPIRSLHRGWSTNEEIRFRAAAGGAMTALGCYLLESGRVDGHARTRPGLTQVIRGTLPDGLVPESK